MNVKRYRKAIAGIGTVVGVIVAATADGVIDATEVGTIVVAVLGAFGVWAAPNDPEPSPPPPRL